MTSTASSPAARSAAISGRATAGCSASKARRPGPISTVFHRRPAPTRPQRTDADIIGSIAARFGYAFGATGQTLVFVKGGAAFIHERHAFNANNVFFAETDKYVRWGWMVGGGLEQALGGGWSMKAEYNYNNFGNKTVLQCDVTDLTNCDDLRIKQHVHLFKVGINYRFGGFGGPVVARY